MARPKWTVLVKGPAAKHLAHTAHATLSVEKVASTWDWAVRTGDGPVAWGTVVSMRDAKALAEAAAAKLES